MSSRRHLVSRSRQNAESSPALRGHGRDSEAPARQPTTLPPYEPPTCPLSASAKRKLDDLRTNRDFAKYSKHIKGSISAISNAAGASNDRLSARQDTVRKQAEKRKRDGTSDDKKPQEHIQAEDYLKQLTKQVETHTEKSERALRDLIDLGDELSMQDTILKEVEENIPATPATTPARRQRGEYEDGEEDQNEAPAADPEILSAVELLKKAKEGYVAKYQSKSLRQRYGDQNDYKNFKRTVHDAQNPGEEAPPVPHASTWFPEENGSGSPASRRRRNNATDDTKNGEDSDDEVVVASATTSLKCCLTLQYFEEPYSTNVCPHTFEKKAIIDYHNVNAVAFNNPNQNGQSQRSERTVKCPQTGCEKMLALSDFYDDNITLRKVKRALKQAAREDYEEDEAEDVAPRGTQRNRPEHVGSEDDSVDVDEDDVRQRSMAKFKKDQSVAPSHSRMELSEPGESENGVMDME